jgi:23S rRNA pseudouridine1911/1915/1917 synthase
VRTIALVVAPGDAGERLDRFLTRSVPDLSRARAQRLIQEGAVSVTGVPAVKASQPVETGTEIAVELRSGPPSSTIVPEAIALDVLHEDADVVVLNKPAGMVMHPAPGHSSGTLVHALAHRFGDRLSAVASGARPGIVHRLDRGTSGVLVVALTDRAHQHLSNQFAKRTVRKEYLALVYGCPDEASGSIDIAIGRDPKDRKRISTRARQARAAVTDWRRIEAFPGFALIEALPRTGRTHQIRVHLAHIHHAIVGDADYAGRQWRGVPEGHIRSLVRAFERPALHAHRLAFAHPTTGAPMAFQAPLAPDIEELLDTLRRWRDSA